jgi:hypothetical protein
MIIINAKASIKVVNGLPQLIVNKQYKHIFQKNSNIYKIFKSKGIKHLLTLLDNGYYFIIDDSIVDFKYANYDGYICTNDKLLKTLGYVKNPDYYLRKGFHANNINDYMMVKFDHKSELLFEAYENDPDTYEIGICYSWGPFQHFIKGIPYFKYNNFYYFSDECDKISLSDNWQSIISENISEYIKEYFVSKFEKLSDESLNDLTNLKTLAKMNNDIEGLEFFETVKNVEDYTKYDALMYILELSQHSQQFGYGFKMVNEIMH